MRSWCLTLGALTRTGNSEPDGMAPRAIAAIASSRTWVWLASGWGRRTHRPANAPVRAGRHAMRGWVRQRAGMVWSARLPNRPAAKVLPPTESAV
jgi:hypothetical protein